MFHPEKQLWIDEQRRIPKVTLFIVKKNIRINFNLDKRLYINNKLFGDGLLPISIDLSLFLFALV